LKKIAKLFETIANINLSPFILSLKLASVTTIILFFISIPLSWFLSQSRSKIKPIIEAIVALPIVLPPSVIGFYMLYLLSQNSPIGSFFEQYLGLELVFNFKGLVIASCFYSLPFMIQPIQSGFESLNTNMLEASYISGKSLFNTILMVAIPNIKPSLITAIVITFAHTIGEFGVVLMVGGSIPEETKVASVAIYEFVEILDYKNAHLYSMFMLSISFLVLLGVYTINKRYKHRHNISI
jgi:molybdate transport system permease protein